MCNESQKGEWREQTRGIFKKMVAENLTKLTLNHNHNSKCATNPKHNFKNTHKHITIKLL